MGKLTVIIVLLFILAGIGGALYLAYGKFPVPSTHVEQVLSNARFSK